MTFDDYRPTQPSGSRLSEYPPGSESHACIHGVACILKGGVRPIGAKGEGDKANLQKVSDDELRPMLCGS